MPLRYSYEAMVITQATRNPFENERMRIQRRLNELTAVRELTKEKAERLEILKISLTKLLGAGANSAREAEALTHEISNIARKGTREQCMKLKVWPEAGKDGATRQIADYFVNARIDLMTREAETFRTDYRNQKRRSIHLALEQPLWNERWGETDRRNGFILAIYIFVCPIITVLILRKQNGKVS
jgi:hypothetical protein